MKWELKKVYLYLVSFATLIMSIIGGWSLTAALVEKFIPAPPYTICNEKPGGAITPEEQKRCEEEQKRQEERDRAFLHRRILQNSAFLVIVVPTFIYHWKQARKTDE